MVATCVRMGWSCIIGWPSIVKFVVYSKSCLMTDWWIDGWMNQWCRIEWALWEIDICTFSGQQAMAVCLAPSPFFRVFWLVGRHALPRDFHVGWSCLVHASEQFIQNAKIMSAGGESPPIWKGANGRLSASRRKSLWLIWLLHLARVLAFFGQRKLWMT